MKLTWWQVYLWLKLDALQDVFGVGAILLTVFLTLSLIGMVISMSEENEDDLNMFFRIFKKLGILCILFWSLFALTPNTKEFATIYILPKIANSKAVQEIFKSSDKISQLLLKYSKLELQEKLLKLKSEKEQSK